jgi:ABC-type transporter Mla maintaining outer membrane lipid asymmetry ATPase subunit MlaF
VGHDDKKVQYTVVVVANQTTVKKKDYDIVTNLWHGTLAAFSSKNFLAKTQNPECRQFLPKTWHPKSFWVCCLVGKNF